MGGRGLHIALLVHRRARRTPRGRGARRPRTLCPGRRATDTSAPGPAWSGGRCGAGPPGSTGQGVWVSTHPRRPPPPESLDRQLRNQPRESSVRKGTQSKGNGPSAKGQGHQGSEVTAVSSRQPEEDKPCGADGVGGPFAPKGRAQSLLTSSRCWRWCWPRRPRPGRRAGGHSSRGRPRRSSASRGARRSGPARAAPRAAGTGTTG